MEDMLSQATLTLDTFGHDVAHFFNPIIPDVTPISGLPLMPFSQAAAVAGGYVCFVTIALLFAKLTGKQKKAETATEIRYKSVGEKFSTEPILLVALLYNAFQVALCVWMVFRALAISQKHEYKWVCNAFKPQEKEMANLLYIFYLSKALDFVDTLLIVARGKWKQLSFLHTYHHTTIFLMYWINSAAGYDGDVYATIVLNGAVHALMYFYYFLRVLEFSVPLALKQCVTHVQKVQFVVMNLQAITILFYNCPYPKRITWTYLFYIITLLYLFQEFANREYGKRKAASKTATKKGK